MLSHYVQVLNALQSKSLYPKKIPSLEPMKEALGLLLNPKKLNPKRTFVVAGTNGKGTICATLESLFLAAGEKVGLYTSPHLQEITERIRLNGHSIAQEEFADAYSAVMKQVGHLSLTHFDTLTLMAVWVFFAGEKHPPVDRAIFEVGMGGTWDSTNAIPHEFCVIASLGYDHERLLGSSLVEIAQNKFGIIPALDAVSDAKGASSRHWRMGGRGATVIHSPLPAEVLPLAQQVQKSTGSQWKESVPFRCEVEMCGNEPKFKIHTPWGSAGLGLPGKRAAQNTATALTAFQACGYDPSSYLSVLSQVDWPGRMEKWIDPTFPCPIYLSGDHNPQGIASLLEMLPHYSRRHLFILVGVGAEKNLDGILGPLFQLKQTSIYLTETPFHGRQIADYGLWLAAAQGGVSSPTQALETIRLLAQEDDLILITGSLYLVGLLRGYLESLRSKPSTGSIYQDL